MASHNELRGRGHIPDTLDQAAITAFLRGLLDTTGMTQVSWAAAAGIPYNTLTNYFTEDPPKMTAVYLMRLVKAAGAEQELADWLQNFTGDSRLPADTPLRQVAEGQGDAYKTAPDVIHGKTPHVPDPLAGGKAKPAPLIPAARSTKPSAAEARPRKKGNHR